MDNREHYYNRHGKKDEGFAIVSIGIGIAIILYYWLMSKIK